MHGIYESISQIRIHSIGFWLGFYSFAGRRRCLAWEHESNWKVFFLHCFIAAAAGCWCHCLCVRHHFGCVCVCVCVCWLERRISYECRIYLLLFDRNCCVCSWSCERCVGKIAAAMIWISCVVQTYALVLGRPSTLHEAWHIRMCVCVRGIHTHAVPVPLASVCVCVCV